MLKNKDYKIISQINDMLSSFAEWSVKTESFAKKPVCLKS